MLFDFCCRTWVNNMVGYSKPNESSTKTMEAAQNSICPKCGYMLREQSSRCPNCFHQFQDHKGSNVEDHKGGNAMDKQRSGNMSPSRVYLNHLSNQLLEIEAKRTALEELYTPLKKDHDELNSLVISVKHQIKREEALNTINGIEPTASSGSKKYKANISYEEVESDEDAAEEVD